MTRTFGQDREHNPQINPISKEKPAALAVDRKAPLLVPLWPLDFFRDSFPRVQSKYLSAGHYSS